MSRATKILAIIVLPQVAAFYAARSVWRAITEKQEELLDGFELAVLEELLSWENAASGFTDPHDDGSLPRLLP